MLRNVIFAVVALLLASCASDETLVVTVPPGTHRIAVVTSLPREFRVATTGFTVFENHLDLVDISDWRLNDVAFEAARAALPGYDVTHASTDAAIYDPANMFQKTPGLGDLVREHAHAEGPQDLYVVIYADQGAYPNSQEKEILQDLGVSKLRSPIGTISPVVHTYLMLAVLDGRTYAVLTKVHLMMDAQRPLESGALLIKSGGPLYPVQPLDGFDWKDDWRDFTPEQKELIRSQVNSLLKQSISYTIALTHLPR